jgi:hypothetical protein
MGFVPLNPTINELATLLVNPVIGFIPFPKVMVLAASEETKRPADIALAPVAYE